MLLGFREGCGLTMPYKLTGANPAQVIASHEPAIEPCRHIGNDVHRKSTHAYPVSTQGDYM